VLHFQNQFDLEYIVINDGSTDRTLSQLQKFGNRIRVIDQENMGESASVNVGIHLAKSEILLVVSADDPLFTAELFVGVENLFARSEGVVAAYCDWKKIDRDGKTLSEIRVPEFDLNLLLGRSRCLPGPGTFFRKSAAIQIGGRNVNWRYVGDFDFWLRLSRRGKIVYRPILAAQWREHESSTSIKFRGAHMAVERIKVVEDFLNDNSNNISSELKKMALGNAYYSAARLCFFDDNVNGKKILTRAFALRGRWIETAHIHEIAFILCTPFSFRLKKLFGISASR
jgi:glycosyltransferase involved in cell wall biosynthesis